MVAVWWQWWQYESDFNNSAHNYGHKRGHFRCTLVGDKSGEGGI